MDSKNENGLNAKKENEANGEVRGVQGHQGGNGGGEGGDEWSVVSSYSRAQAIEDGVLVDASSMGREAGVSVPVALTAAVWGRYVEFDKKAEGQDVNGRLWDVLTMFRLAAKGTAGAELLFRLHVAMPDRGDWQPNETAPERGSDLTRETHRLVMLKAVIGPGDTPEPVITIMLPDED